MVGGIAAEHAAKRRDRAPPERGNTFFGVTDRAVPASCLSTPRLRAQGAGLRFISASVSQMLSGSCILFTAALSVIVLRAKLNKLHYAGDPGRPTRLAGGVEPACAHVQQRARPATVTYCAGGCGLALAWRWPPAHHVPPHCRPWVHVRCLHVGRGGVLRLAWSVRSG